MAPEMETPQRVSSAGAEARLRYGTEEQNADQTEEEMQSRRVKSGFIMTLYLLLHSFIGTGVIFLPGAFKNGGLVLSIFMIMLVGYLTYTGMKLIVRSSEKVPGALESMAFSLFGPRFRALVSTSIFATQVGTCLGYMIFISRTIRDVYLVFTDCEVDLPIWQLMLGQFLFYVPLSLIRNLALFAPFGMMSTLLMAFALGVTLVRDILQMSEFGAGDFVLFNGEKFHLFFGIAVYTFEGVCLIKPIMLNMLESEKFGKALRISSVITVSLYVLVGALSYAAFGTSTRALVLAHLPPRDHLTVVTKLAIVLAVAFTVPVMLYPALRLLEGLIPKKRHSVVRIPLAIGTLAVTTVGAWAGSSSIEHVLALIGTLACSPLSLVYPPLIHMRAISKTKGARLLDLAFAVLGVVSTIASTIIILGTWEETNFEDDILCPPKRVARNAATGATDGSFKPVHVEL